MQKPVILIVPSFSSAAPERMAFELAGELAAKGYAVKVAALRRSRHHHRAGDGRIELLFGITDLVRCCLRLLRSQECLLVHTHGLRPDVAGLFLKLIFMWRVSWVSTMHNDVKEDLRISHGLVGRLVAPIWLRLVVFSDRVVFLNEHLLEKYGERFGFGKASAIRNGRLRKDGGASRTRTAPLHPSHLAVGYLGVLTPLKRIVPLARALSDLPDVTLTVAGKGPLLDAIQDIYRGRSGLNYLGQIDDISSFFAQIDVLVLPSVSEGFPLVVPEALAHGVPCVLSRLGQYRSLYGKKGVFFIDDVSIESLSQVFGALRRDYAMFSAEARRLWVDELTAEIMADQYDRLYASV